MHMLKFYLVNTGNSHFINSNESATGEPLIMLEGCTLSNSVNPEYVSGFLACGNRGRSLKWCAGLFNVKE